MANFKKKDDYLSRSGSKGSFHQIHQLLPRVMNQICKVYDDRPDMILAAWAGIIGPSFAPMTEALSFYDGVLTVKVRNSTLYSLLSQYEKNRLLKNLREKFPNTVIKTIHFRC